MLRLIAVLFVLGLGAIGWVLLLPQKSNAPRLVSATVIPPNAASSPAPAPVDASQIRVVYPGPDGTVGVRKLSDKIVASANVVPARTSAPAMSPQAAMTGPSAPPAPAAAPDTSVPVPNANSTAVATAETSVVAPAPANAQALNINTASVEALNQIPGAGHIGRTIASHRPYRSVEDLLSKRVVRKSVYDLIKNQVAAN